MPQMLENRTAIHSVSESRCNNRHSMAKSRLRPHSYPHHYDPIRIVPLYLPDTLAAAPAARLTYRHGPLISSVEVFTTFWARASRSPPRSALVGERHGVLCSVR